MSEYIPRLRDELVAAAARERAGVRHRPRVPRRTVTAALVAAAIVVALVLAVRSIDLPNDERPAGSGSGELAFRSPDAARCADVLRARIAAMGIGAVVSVSGDEVTVEASPPDHAAIAALTAPGRFAVYDWEASVLGPDGRPAPADAQVTGGSDPGIAGAVSRDEAARRAAKADGEATVVRSVGGAGWYAIGGPAPLGNADVANAMSLREPATREPIVAIELTARGQAVFESLTRTVAQRGADAHRPGEASMREFQHLAIVFDGEIASVPFIDFQRAPDGIDGADGVQISGDLAPERTQEIAAMLRSGPMPAPLDAAP